MKYHSKPSATRQRREQDINTNNDRTSSLVVRRQPSKQDSRKTNDRNLNQVRLSKRNSRVNLHRDQSDQSNQMENQINDLQRQLNTLRQTQHEEQGLTSSKGCIKCFNNVAANSDNYYFPFCNVDT